MPNLRILVVSNLYPPHCIGGYELGCRDVVHELRARGHSVDVLTSFWGVDRPCSEGPIHRWLEVDFGGMPDLIHLMRLAQMEACNGRAFARAVDELKPDIVYFWNMGHLSISLAFAAHARRIPSCYYVFDEWLSKWESDAWFNLCRGSYNSAGRRIGQKMLRPALRFLGMMPVGELDLTHAQFASYFLKGGALAAGKAVSACEVIHWGIDIARFPYQAVLREPKRILYAGQLVPVKGVGTAIEAMNIIVNFNGRRDVHLTIAGGGANQDYSNGLRKIVDTYGLQQQIRFIGSVPHERLPDVYKAHDISIFPSMWDEPFGIVLLESFSSGLAVVGTGTGGAAEIIQDGFNALIFPRGDAGACAERILRLQADPELFHTIRQNGRRTAELKFRFQNTVDAIEASLERMAPATLRRPQLSVMPSPAGNL